MSADPTPLPSVSVVAPTHNRRDRLPPLIDALLAEPVDEILIVVNACQDGSLELLEERAERDPRLKPLYVAEPGQVLAVRAGVEKSSGEVLLMLDDDVIPEPGLAVGHARHHAAGRGLVVLGYMPVVHPRRRRAGQYPIDLYSRAYERVCDSYERDPREILKSLWAGNVSIRPEDFRCAANGSGGRLMTGYAYHEDRDFGLRCEAAGLTGVFDRSLLARHHFEKDPAEFLAAARNSGRARAAVHDAHPDTLGPLPETFFEHEMPNPGRSFVRMAQDRHLYRPIQALLRAVTRATGALHLFRIESHVGYVMGTIEQQRAAFADDVAEAGG
jgi:glycosyltransferase involved in cell wall biosynthesis